MRFYFTQGRPTFIYLQCILFFSMCFVHVFFFVSLLNMCLGARAGEVSGPAERRAASYCDWLKRIDLAK